MVIIITVLYSILKIIITFGLNNIKANIIILRKSKHQASFSNRYIGGRWSRIKILESESRNGFKLWEPWGVWKLDLKFKNYFEIFKRNNICPIRLKLADFDVTHVLENTRSTFCAGAANTSFLIWPVCARHRIGRVRYRGPYTVYLRERAHCSQPLRSSSHFLIST